MSVTLINNFGIGTTDFTAMMATINKSYKGKSEITLSNYDNDTAPAVKVGSVFDCNGAIYLVETVDETPSGYPGISNDTMFYLVFDVSALAFVYTSTAPTWDDDKQGWYDGNNRYFFSMYKDSGGTLYDNKAFMNHIVTKKIDTSFKVNKGIKPTGVHVGTATDGEMYDMFDSLVPNIGDRIKVTGGLVALGITFPASHIERQNATAINLWCIPNTGSTWIALFKDNTTSRDWSIAW